MPPKKITCKGKTQQGKSCKRLPMQGSDFCSAHQPVETNDEKVKRLSKTFRSMDKNTITDLSNFSIIDPRKHDYFMLLDNTKSKVPYRKSFLRKLKQKQEQKIGSTKGETIIVYESPFTRTYGRAVELELDNKTIQFLVEYHSLSAKMKNLVIPSM